MWLAMVATFLNYCANIPTGTVILIVKYKIHGIEKEQFWEISILCPRSPIGWEEMSG